MHHKTSYLLPVIGLSCAALLVTLALSMAGPDALAGRLGPIRALIAFALLSGLLALWLARLLRAELTRMDATRERIETTLNALPDAVIRIDGDGRPICFNPAGESLLGLAGHDGPEGSTSPWQLIDHQTRAPLLAALLARSHKDGLTRIPPGARLINRHGLELEVEGECLPLPGRDGQTGHYLLQLRDVTEAREWLRQQPDLWDRDPVSTLPGRAFMENRLNRALRNRRGGDLPLTYLALSFNGIQAVYDEVGSQAGDALIRHLTALLRAHVRDTDLVARLDSQAYAVLLTSCPAEISQRIAGEIRAALADFSFHWEGLSHPIAVAIGQVDAPPFDGCLDELLAAAAPGR